MLVPVTSVYADVGANGRVNDGAVWNKCGFSNAIENNQLSLPTPRCLPGGIQNIPFVLIGDDAFALEKHMMKPYPQQNLTTERRVYNYRHSRGRRIANRWRIYHTVILLQPKAVESIILARLALHNMTRFSD